MDVPKATPSFWRAKVLEGRGVDPVFITSQQVGRYLEKKQQQSEDPYGMSSLQGKPLKNKDKWDQACVRGSGVGTAGSSWKENRQLRT